MADVGCLIWANDPQKIEFEPDVTHLAFLCQIMKNPTLDIRHQTFPSDLLS